MKDKKQVLHVGMPNISSVVTPEMIAIKEKDMIEKQMNKEFSITSQHIWRKEPKLTRSQRRKAERKAKKKN